jgi:hypothetical protein
MVVSLASTSTSVVELAAGRKKEASASDRGRIATGSKRRKSPQRLAEPQLDAPQRVSDSVGALDAPMAMINHCLTPSMLLGPLASRRCDGEAPDPRLCPLATRPRRPHPLRSHWDHLPLEVTDAPRTLYVLRCVDLPSHARAYLIRWAGERDMTGAMPNAGIIPKTAPSALTAKSEKREWRPGKHFRITGCLKACFNFHWRQISRSSFLSTPPNKQRRQAPTEAVPARMTSVHP